MAKIHGSTCNCNHSGGGGANLDTLAQLVTNPLKPLSDKGKADCTTDSKKTLQKRAIAKRITGSYLYSLIDLNSDLQRSYWTTYHCSNVLLQDGAKLTGKYCNQRWCLVCNRIRIAKMVLGYKPSIDAMQNPWFVTLTVKAVQAKDLKETVQDLLGAAKKVTRNLRKKYGLNVVGLRKLECNYNPKTKTYNPHFHFVVDGCKSAFYLYGHWCRHWKGTNRVNYKGQHIRPADDKALVELFKYFAKVVTNKSFYPEQMDTIFKAMKGKRTFQPLGGLTRAVNEDVEEIQSQTVDWLTEQTEIWKYESVGSVVDWWNSLGEGLCDAVLSPTINEYIQGIENSVKRKKSLLIRLNTS